MVVPQNLHAWLKGLKTTRWIMWSGVLWMRVSTTARTRVDFWSTTSRRKELSSLVMSTETRSSRFLSRLISPCSLQPAEMELVSCCIRKRLKKSAHFLSTSRVEMQPFLLCLMQRKTKSFMWWWWVVRMQKMWLWQEVKKVDLTSNFST